MPESDAPKSKSPTPIGNLSVKDGDGWKQTGTVWFRRNKTGGYFVIRCKEAFSLEKDEVATLFLNNSSYRLAFIKRGTILL